jgi:hypothetical protein
MNFLYKIYEISSPLEPQAASERIEHLLSHEGVQYVVNNLRVTSTSTPIVLLNFQSQLYTRKNWVGVNPFAFVTGVDIQCETRNSAGTRIIVRNFRRRAILNVVFWGVIGFLMARAMSEPAAATFIGALLFTAWFANVTFLAGYLINREITKEVRGGAADGGSRNVVAKI